MKVNGIDHVNIIAGDVEETVRFYERVLGFKTTTPPMVVPGFQGRWLCDAEDRPIIHLMGYTGERHAGLDRAGTGSIDHVALACAGFAGIVARCEELGVPHQVNDREYGGLRQVFVKDPNNVTLELNFAGD